MYRLKEIADRIYYVGVNDRQKSLFENLWELPNGVSYNSYLVIDEQTVLIDTVDVCYSDVFLKKIADALNGRPLDYLIINHMEPDHAGSIRLLRQQYPDVQLVGNRATFGMLEGYHGINTGLHEVKDGSVLTTGKHEFTFYTAPMVHWPEVMFAYESTEKILFSADAFGTFGTLDGGIIDSDIRLSYHWEEMYRYYACIVGKYGNPVQRALQKLKPLDIKTICSTHGPVWREHIDEAVSIYDRLSRYEGEEGVVIVYGSMYGNTEQMAEAIAFGLAENGMKTIILHNVSKSHPSEILRDVFKYKGLILGSPTYSNQLFPEMESIMSKIELREVKDRVYGFFGSFTWSSAAVKRLAAFGEKMKWETTGAPVEQKQAMAETDYEACIALGRAVAEKMNGI